MCETFWIEWLDRLQTVSIADDFATVVVTGSLWRVLMLMTVLVFHTPF
jgi:hypothetical protein